MRCGSAGTRDSPDACRTARVGPSAGSGADGSGQACVVSRSIPTTPAPAIFVVVRMIEAASSG
jgi:hypothetical protein